MLSLWLERLRDLRNQKVSDPDFRRWAARFVPTRWVARRQAAALFDLTAGFVYSQILAACVRCDLFAILAKGPLPLETIAVRIGLPEEGAERLVRAAAALDLIETRRGDRYALGPLGAALVNNPGVSAMVVHHDMLYRDLADPLMLLAGATTSELGTYWAYAGAGRAIAPASQGTSPRGTTSSREAARDANRHADYTALMAASQTFVTSEILDAYPVGRHQRLLDVGGGDGSFLVAAGRSAPELSLSLFDLPPVAVIARQKILACGLSARTTVHAGSVFDEALPPGADLVTLNRVLHDHDDRAALEILKAVRRAIAPSGTILVAEPMAGTQGARASGDAYFGFYLLAMGQGRPRRIDEIEAMLAKAGFDTPVRVRTATPLIVRIVTAKASGR